MPRVRLNPVRPTIEPDELDFEAIDDLHRHQGFQLVQQRIDRAIEECREQLCTVPAAELAHKQGFIAGLRRARSIGQILKNEIRERAKKL